MMTGDFDPVPAIALTLVPRVGDVHARMLIDRYKTAEAVFAAPRRELEAMPGIGSMRAESIRSFRAFHQAEAEWAWVKRNEVKLLVYGQDHYPRRLSHCADAPVVMYGRGDLRECDRVVAVIGTRKPSPWALKSTQEIIREMASLEIQVISGLAQGVDTEAHKVALSEGLSTIAVLGHGLDIIYPPSNARLAREMVMKGGLLTEFRNGTLPDAPHFPRRNRIVAGLSDAALVIETGVKGGSMITARLAFDYDRDLFALPGRVYDEQSKGCNRLIQENKAMLVTEASDIIRAMNWDTPRPADGVRQATLFTELEPEEERIVSILRDIPGGASADDIALRAGIRVSHVSAMLLGLEMKGCLKALPGQRYCLN